MVSTTQDGRWIKVIEPEVSVREECTSDLLLRSREVWLRPEI